MMHIVEIGEFADVKTCLISLISSDFPIHEIKKQDDTEMNISFVYFNLLAIFKRPVTCKLRGSDH